MNGRYLFQSSDLRGLKSLGVAGEEEEAGVGVDKLEGVKEPSIMKNGCQTMMDSS